MIGPPFGAVGSHRRPPLGTVVRMRAAGIVLAGGRSSRMGRSKAALAWHGSTLLRRVTGLLTREVDGPVIVVGAPDHRLPALPAEVRVVADPEPGRGPVVGLATGLGAASDAGAEVVFVSATDLPFLHLAYVARLLTALTEHAVQADVALPHLSGYPQPLAAAYRTSLAPVLAEMVSTGEARLRELFTRCRVRRLDREDLLANPVLAAADPALASVSNINSPEDYAAALVRPAPSVTVRLGGSEYQVAAATLGTALAQARAASHASRAGITQVRAASGSGAGPPGLAAPAVVDPVVVEALTGTAVYTEDAELPLVAGDVVRPG
jgi:molybdenum cofactor guanylyltransferase